MTESERLTEKRDGQNVIPLRQDGKTKWALTSAGMGNASTQFLYGTHADKLADYEEIGTIEEFKAFRSGDFTEDLLNMGYTKGYNKAIDEFVEKLIGRLEEYRMEYKSGFGELTDELVFRVMGNTISIVKELAEQMKGGATDERTGSD